MRDIKFRGYAVEKMVNTQWRTGYGILSIDYVDNSEEYWLMANDHETQIKKESIGQYIGLQDKNGVEIYEGDIIKDCEGTLKTVIWRNNGFQCEHKVRKTYQGDSYIDTIYSELHKTEDRRWGDEVTGNIFENSEMVEIE